MSDPAQQLATARAAYWTAYHGAAAASDLAAAFVVMLEAEKACSDSEATLRRLIEEEATLRTLWEFQDEAEGYAVAQADRAHRLFNVRLEATWQRKRISAANLRARAEREAERIKRAADSIRRRRAYADSVIEALRA